MRKRFNLVRTITNAATRGATQDNDYHRLQFSAITGQ